MNRLSLLLLILCGFLSPAAFAQSSGNLPPTPKRGLNFYYDTMMGMDILKGDKGVVIFRAIVDENGQLTEITTVQPFTKKADKTVEEALSQLSFYPARSQHRPIPSEVLLAFYLEYNPPVPLTSSEQDFDHSKVSTYFPELPTSENTFLFYPMMPNWEDEKLSHLGENRIVLSDVLDKEKLPNKDNANEILEMEDLEERRSEPEEPAGDYDFGELDIDGENTPETEMIPDINDFVQLEREPMPVNLDDVKRVIGFPGTAKNHDMDGKVIIRMLVDKKGYVADYVNLRPTLSPFLVEAVTAGVPLLVFTPGTQASEPVYCWVSIPFTFKLLK